MRCWMFFNRDLAPGVPEAPEVLRFQETAKALDIELSVLKPSEFDIEVIETSSIFQISRDDLIELYVQHPQFDRHFRVEIENEFIKLQKRVLQSIGSTAMERYVDFVECHPRLLNRISNVQIASYLGMTPEFLSKIRKGMLG